ncbi:hypothetical protein [Candidatus Finniella inopinata]|uniref:Uncharacterized protein n=1 Tax=Candidatus Finniella inopinata TaxID=1696036 RepID=A0A4Q7DHG6_9PROT|nr:hypothetical protein [Candidatus Finniella inopinata]RZI45475.1 hypothetical protein EQU50_06940 [Candidatus Finniella inopinata]
MKKKHGFVLEEENINSIPEITTQEKETFLLGINQQRTPQRPGKAFDPKAKPTYGINVRLNDYQLDLIRRVCEKEERSQQQIIKRILVPALENHISDMESSIQRKVGK